MHLVVSRQPWRVSEQGSDKVGERSVGRGIWGGGLIGVGNAALGPGLKSQREVTRQGLHSPAIWGRALHREDLRNCAADKELVTTQSLPGMSYRERGLPVRQRGGCLCSRRPELLLSSERPGRVRRGLFQSLRGRRSLQKRARERKG